MKVLLVFNRNRMEADAFGLQTTQNMGRRVAQIATICIK